MNEENLLNGLEEALVDRAVTLKIVKENQDEFKNALRLIEFIESSLLPDLNNLNPSADDRRISQAIFVLYAQAVQSYKTGVLLSLTGYFSNAVMILRNHLEVLFNIKYILSDKTKQLSRSENYLTKPQKWTDSQVKERAYSGLDRA